MGERSFALQNHASEIERVQKEFEVTLKANGIALGEWMESTGTAKTLRY